MNIGAVSGRKVRKSTPMEAAARAGLTARALIYLLIGVLVIAIAAGHKRTEADQRGAMQAVSTHTGGAVLILLIAIGLAGYALWRFAEAAFGVAGEGNKAGPRLQSFARGLIYGFFAVTAFTVFAGRQQSQAVQSTDLSARVMRHDGGRLLVGIVGAVIVVVGLVLIGQGAHKRFMKYFRTSKLNSATRKTVVRLGMVGTIARGAVFALAGALVIDAAVQFKPKKAAGIDSVIRTLAGEPFGTALLIVVAAGLLAFGIYGLAEARWRVT